MGIFNMSKVTKKPQRSLRTILISWFLLVSLVPLAFVTGYSIIKYEKALDNELIVRLQGNAREIKSIFKDFENGIRVNRNKYIKDPSLIYSVSVEDLVTLKEVADDFLSNDISSNISFFTRDGRLLTSVFHDEKGGIRSFTPAANSAVYLSDENLEKLKQEQEYSFIDFSGNQKVSLVVFSKLLGKSGKLVGYVEQLIDINEAFLTRLKDRLKLELFLLKPQSLAVMTGTHEDFYLYKKNNLPDLDNKSEFSFFDLSLRGQPLGAILTPIKWGKSEMILGLGASKAEAKSVLKNVNYAFFSVVGTIIFVLIIIIFLISNTILRPINDLLEAIWLMQSSDKPVEIPIKNETEIGLLTESLNQMSRNVIQARSDLKKKILELEQANQELKETQARLVHSSKMVSLGQLVAGVAHELNNPIGFIYSNMPHLRDYSEKLMRLADIAQQNPETIEQAKRDLDIEYIKKDLPKLISSCEDGARRTRDIVLGLRNFSRIEEAQLKEININEAIDNTLSLLSGEIKNRIQIHKDYGQVSLVNCYASQINQVFMNILSNSVQAIDEKGNIWISTKEIEKNKKKYVSISFQDSGKGMTPQVMEKVFDPFFSTKGVGQGTGLGMSISYGIIQKHRGEILVKSQVGIGTEFTVNIPVQYEEISF